MTTAIPSTIARLAVAAGPAGLSPDALETRLPQISRSTLNRRLAALVKDGIIKAVGAGRATRYVCASPLTGADIDAYFSRPWQQRPVAQFNEDLLAAQPGLDPGRVAERSPAISPGLERRREPIRRFILLHEPVDRGLRRGSDLIHQGVHAEAVDLDAEADLGLDLVPLGHGHLHRVVVDGRSGWR